MAQDYPSHVKRWDVFEVVLNGTSEGNPYTEQTLTGIFTSRDESVTVRGFYDGDGVYRIRFMPSYEGRYTFILRASFFEGTLSGAFYADPADEDVHGPVRVSHRYHFAYDDGTPFTPVGTTAYVWELQNDETVRDTLESLKQSSFNKLRFCIFPKHYVFNLKDPDAFPYEGTPVDASDITSDNFTEYTGKSEGNHFDYQRFNPVYFRRIEKSIKLLRNEGIEADLILFHPYDRWGFSTMSEDENELYLNYVTNRFAAYRNVWWSLANEWDLLKDRSEEEWEKEAQILVKKDPYQHLRSIHNCQKMYDQTESWITHVSAQRIDLYKTAEVTDELREKYQKPVIMDELGYEGDLPYGFGNLTGEEEVRRFWETALRGGYPGHGETFLNPDHVIWWSHGGHLQGESWKRVGFLWKIMSEVPGNGIAYLDNEWDSTCGVPEDEINDPVKSQYIYYYSFMRPSWRDFHVDDETDYVVEVIDTWNMTIHVAGIFKGAFRVQLPGKQYMAIRLRKAEEDDYKSLNSEEESVEEPEPLPETEKTVEMQEVPHPVSGESGDSMENVSEDAEEDVPEESDYMEATVVRAKTETAPSGEGEDRLSPFPADAEVQQEEYMQEETLDETDEPVDEEGPDDLELPDDSDNEEDELPDIVTGKLTRIDVDQDALDHTSELRKMPVEDEEEHTGHSGTLNILTSLRRRRKNQ